MNRQRSRVLNAHQHRDLHENFNDKMHQRQRYANEDLWELLVRQLLFIPNSVSSKCHFHLIKARVSRFTTEFSVHKLQDCPNKRTNNTLRVYMSKIDLVRKGILWHLKQIWPLNNNLLWRTKIIKCPKKYTEMSLVDVMGAFRGSKNQSY